MSKNNNVNPGQYKVAGRERQGENIVPQVERAKILKGRPTVSVRRNATKKR